MSKWMTAIVLIVGMAALNACKKTFDNPPGPGDPDLVANMSIANLKALHTVPRNYDIINDDIIISGIVVANDKSGNFYKQLFIQDTTGAIQLLVDATSLFGSYPVGRRVFVRCKGLCISDYNNTIQLGVKATVGGTPSLEGIPAATMGNYLIGGSINNPVEPITVTLNDLTTNMQNRYINALIKLEGYEFIPGDTSKTYSDTSVYKSTVNLNIKNCQSNVQTIVRTSAYANFAGLQVPKGNGNITSIYTVFGTTRQLIIRDTADVQFYNDRCGSVLPPAMTIAQLRAMYTGSGIKLTTPASIAGVVISDAANKNISTGAFVLQQGNAGIMVYYGGTITYNIGDSLRIDITNDSLINYRGSLELKKQFGSSLPAVTATGRVINPAVKTIAELNTAMNAPLGDPANIEFTLVKVNNATMSGTGTTYSGSKTLTDASGNMTIFTSSSALFSGSVFPTTPKNFTGYTSYINTTKQFLIRNLNDVQ